MLFSNWAKQRESLTAGLLGGGGAALYFVAQWLDVAPLRLYASYDYWHTSPNFFLARVGILLMILFACYAWCRWGAGAWRFSPMIQLGQTSLLVYWVHIEFVYGRFSILPKQAVSISTASLGLLAIFVAMLLLSMARTRLKGRGAEALIWLRRAARPAREG
jgi:fucose 4-O-acetylase-like acetyltransferase